MRTSLYCEASALTRSRMTRLDLHYSFGVLRCIGIVEHLLRPLILGTSAVLYMLDEKTSHRQYRSYGIRRHSIHAQRKAGEGRRELRIRRRSAGMARRGARLWRRRCSPSISLLRIRTLERRIPRIFTSDCLRDSEGAQLRRIRGVRIGISATQFLHNRSEERLLRASVHCSRVEWRAYASERLQLVHDSVIFPPD